MTHTLVEIAQGRLQGHESSGVVRFLGIPYAGPVSGAGRWRPAPPARAWTGVRDAAAYGPRAIQLVTTARPEIDALHALVAPPAGWRSEQSEDCLNLNVFAPDRAGTKRPVMVWLHGGGYFGESPPIWWSEGGALTAEQDVVVVTVRHRIGLMGHLHLADLSPRADLALSGNVSIDDLITALCWVRANIAAFGGDPGNVTIFGESGGGAKVCILMNTPAAQGLFHRAIVQSGPSLQAATREEATKSALHVLKALGLDAGDVERLIDIPTDKILEVQAALLPIMRSPWETSGKLTGMSPVVDGDFLPHQPFSPAAMGMASAVPLLIGTNKDEARILAARPADAFDMTLERARQIMGRSAGPRLDEAWALYSAQTGGGAPSDVFFAYMSDYMERDRSIVLAERRVRRRAAATFMYFLEFGTDVLGGKLGAPHTLDIPLVFGRADLGIAGTDPDRHAVSAAMRAAWAAFAREGEPAGGVLSPWPAYDEDRRATMVFAAPPRLSQDPAREARLYWRAGQDPSTAC